MNKKIATLLCNGFIILEEYIAYGLVFCFGIKDIKIISRAKVRRAKLYYLRERTGKSARLKRRF